VFVCVCSHSSTIPSMSENMRPRPPPRARTPSSAAATPSASPSHNRPYSPRVVLQPIASGMDSSSSGSLIDDRSFMSSRKNDIMLLVTKMYDLHREVELQRRPASMAAKGTLSRRPLTPSSSSGDIALPLRREDVESSVSKAYGLYDSGSPVEAKLALMEIMSTVLEEANKLAITLTDRQLGSEASKVPLGTVSKVTNGLALLSRAADLHTLLEGNAVTKRPVEDQSGAASSELLNAILQLSTVFAKYLRGSSSTVSSSGAAVVKKVTSIMSSCGLSVPRASGSSSVHGEIKAANRELVETISSACAQTPEMQNAAGALAASAKEAEKSWVSVVEVVETCYSAVEMLSRHCNTVESNLSLKEKELVQLKEAAKNSESNQAAAGKELYEEKVSMWETETEKLRFCLRSSESQLEEANQNISELRESLARADSSSAASSNASQLQQELEEAKQECKSVAEEKEDFKAKYEKLKASEEALQTQFNLLKDAYHNECSKPSSNAGVDELKTSLKHAQNAELSARGELSIMKETVEQLRRQETESEIKSRNTGHALEALQRESEDKDLQISCLRAELESVKRLSKDSDTFEEVLADELCTMREAYEAKLKSARSQLDREHQTNAVTLKELKESYTSETRTLKRRVDFLQSRVTELEGDK